MQGLTDASLGVTEATSRNCKAPKTSGRETGWTSTKMILQARRAAADFGVAEVDIA
jgi:hypothetical protein